MKLEYTQIEDVIQLLKEHHAKSVGGEFNKTKARFLMRKHMDDPKTLMLVNKTIHGGLKVLGDIISDGVYTISGYNGVFSNTLYVGAKITGIANLEIGTTAWIKGDTTIGEVAIDTATLTVYGLINVPAGPEPPRQF